MEKAIEDHDMEALQKAIEYNPCGICRKTLKKIGNEDGEIEVNYKGIFFSDE